MNLIDSINIQRYHRERIRLHGEGSTGALGWKQPAGQEARFDVLSQVGDLNGRSVLDAGCGHGDLCAFLHKKFSDVRYIGVEMDEAFLQVAVEKYGAMDNTAFFAGDFTSSELPVTDYILACGALSYRSSDPDFALQAIRRLFASCRFGFAFNMLRRVESPGGILVAYDPDLIVTHCRTLTSETVLKENYYEDDFTVMLYK